MLRWVILLAVYLACSLLGDYASKRWSLPAAAGGWWIAAMVAYAVGNTFWLMAIRIGYGLSRGGVVFNLGLAIGCCLLGVFIFREVLSWRQVCGLCLGVLSIYLLLGDA